MKIKKFELEAIKVKNLLDRKIIRLSSDFVPNNKLDKKTKELQSLANSFFRSSSTGEKISLIHTGETECLAFSSLCNSENLIVIDERTTRMLVESPDSLKSLMEKKLHINLKQDNSVLKEFKKFRIIRSAELLFIAYKKNLIPLKKDKQLLEALLYAVKYKGTTISSSEIEELKRLA